MTWQAVQQWGRDKAPKRTRLERAAVALHTTVEYLLFEAVSTPLRTTSKTCGMSMVTCAIAPWCARLASVIEGASLVVGLPLAHDDRYASPEFSRAQ